MRYSLFIFFLIILNQICGAGIINVPGDSATIQSGINGALEGDTVLVAPGTYTENVEIDKPISLIGLDWDSCIVDGSNTGVVVLITSNYVNVEKLSVIHSGSNHYDAGVKLAYADSCVIDSCQLYDNGKFGFAMYYAWYNIISNCMIYRNECGICLTEEYDPDVPGTHTYTFKNRIINNFILNNSEHGIKFDHTGSYHYINHVSGNYIACNQHGMYMITSRENEISHNIFHNNTMQGIVFEQCHWNQFDNIFHHNSFFNNSGGYDQAYELMYEGSNYWHLPDSNEGNYWSNYTGIDENEDGIGDEAFPIGGPTDAYDMYPLFYSPVNIRGDANTDMIVNVGDAVFVINYVFKSGPTPEPLLCGDANWDGAVNVGDAVNLINFIFKNGPPPCAP